MKQSVESSWMLRNQEEMGARFFDGIPTGEICIHVRAEAQRIRDLTIRRPRHSVVYSVPRQVLKFFSKLEAVSEPVPAWDAGAFLLANVPHYLAIGEDGQLYVTRIAPHQNTFLDALRLEDFFRRTPRHQWRNFMVSVHRHLERQ